VRTKATRSFGMRSFAPCRCPGAARSSFGHCVAGQSLFIAGGHLGKFHSYQRNSFTNELLRYDVGTDSWRQLQPMPIAAQGFRMVEWRDDIYAFGGFVHENTLPSMTARSTDGVYRYSIGKNEWSPIAEMPRRRSSNIIGLI
jgi:N-acetylneuraminic acid mutarotase